MDLQNAYCYDERRRFTQIEEAEPDPEHPGEYLWPANSTPVKPDQLPAIWSGTVWMLDVSDVAAIVRGKRAEILAKTDFMLMPDYPITPLRAKALREYRQQLRDLPAQPDFPGKVAWPAMPDFVHNLFHQP